MRIAFRQEVDYLRSNTGAHSNVEYIEEEDNPTLLIKRARVPHCLPIFLTVNEAKDLLVFSNGVTEPESNLAIMRIMIQAEFKYS